MCQTLNFVNIKKEFTVLELSYLVIPPIIKVLHLVPYKVQAYFTCSRVTCTIQTITFMGLRSTDFHNINQIWWNSHFIMLHYDNNICLWPAPVLLHLSRISIEVTWVLWWEARVYPDLSNGTVSSLWTLIIIGSFL